MKGKLIWTTCGRSKHQGLETKVLIKSYEISDLGEMSKGWVL